MTCFISHALETVHYTNRPRLPLILFLGLPTPGPSRSSDTYDDKMPLRRDKSFISHDFDLLIFSLPTPSPSRSSDTYDDKMPLRRDKSFINHDFDLLIFSPFPPVDS